MTNSELIEKLKKMPPEAKVEIHDNETGTSYSAEDVMMASGAVSIGYRDLA